ncbi:MULTISPECIES: hypoxanthine/guanine phosphoribosyltransferase [Methanothermobacter]|jgi:adenine phosphoribosyltransferase|uniref:Hypoxanthine/guanine phosphoribosyltransferase n=3 Tax=Methanothermobacter TaxID=145260 RepID=HPRT_METTH|nr:MULTISPECIES: hypoxanthine/guanine phosphoribosyltransferase [Methanothermobacter]O27375.2 RecName: Full=Hypoxanthine/guanine phosphoribosyltransferase; Short=HGPRTase [Methanothermobacter thermautotrophicus str. Delta H]MBC7110773.1 adenine phosphoribosyltransferase [Methanothermobacter sp.]MDK2874500.1 adenine phosphoribosyltransferase [Methanothermobacter sp.]MDN5373845.1 adenine phosphoribosyltransferase [Methanothermobacter sp.]REE28076.1 adenine phosphoribosyltransferase [Methanotherm
MLDKLKESLRNSPVIKKGEYDYFVNPVTDGIPLTEPELLEEVAEEIVRRFRPEADKIICIEAMGIHHATVLSLKTGIPFVVVRKRRYGLPGEVAVHQMTGYSEGELYINGVDSGDRVVVIDDVVSTGGTLLAVLEALREMDVDVRDVITVIDKGEGSRVVRERTGFTVKSLVKVDVIDGRVKVEDIPAGGPHD